MKTLHQRTKSQDVPYRNLEKNQSDEVGKSGYPLWILLIPACFVIASILMTGFVLLVVSPHTATFEDGLDDYRAWVKLTRFGVKLTFYF